MPGCARPAVPWQVAQVDAQPRTCKGSTAWALAQPHKVVSMPTAAILFHRFMLSPEKFAGETGP